MHQLIKLEISRFVSERVASRTTQTQWEQPLVGFADAQDPLFNRLKQAVRPTHANPEELLPQAKTVIAYYLPFVQQVARSNVKQLHASKEWALAYIETNQLIIDLNNHLAELLQKYGYTAKVLPPTHNFDTEQLMADWSHKHIAYIAGLGTFGLHHMLITDKGCCGRFGSLVTNAVIAPTPRPQGEYCLAHHNGSCKVCIKKCPNNALTEDGYDRHKCYALLLENAEIYEQHGLADVCGKCSSVVPCSYLNPVKKLIEKQK